MPWSSSVIHMRDLAQNRVEAGEGGIATPPLRIVDDASAVKTGVNIGRNKPGSMTHRSLCRFDQEISDLLLSIGATEKTLINVKICASARIVDAFVVRAASSAVELSVS
jgi:hypothetical protein